MHAVAKPRVLIYNRDINDVCEEVRTSDTKVIASTQIGGIYIYLARKISFSKFQINSCQDELLQFYFNLVFFYDNVGLL